MRTEYDIRIKVEQTLYTGAVDEAGCGCWAGDLVVAAVILDPKNPIIGLNDSKKLTEKKREALYPEIIEKSLDYCIIHITPQKIDEINILEARMLGMKMALEGLTKLDYAIIDGNKIPKGLLVETDFIIAGDAKFKEIGAASILAKVTRDRQIIEQSKLYPEYGFENHKGYGTKEHMCALDKYGPIKDFHRFSYKPIKNRLT